jgi:hypothetical protein
MLSGMSGLIDIGADTGFIPWPSDIPLPGPQDEIPVGDHHIAKVVESRVDPSRRRKVKLVIYLRIRD